MNRTSGGNDENQQRHGDVEVVIEEEPVDVNVNIGGLVNEQVQANQLFDEMDISLTMQGNGDEEEQIDVQHVEEVVPLTPIGEILKKIRRRKSERIVKRNLSKVVGGPNDPGMSKEKAVNLD
ncbi:hypothetical protein L2E82_44889 [Cichorium intybus]|uniref:Uncharacterized protein n=1 Tax=Cichorium intybus TaxID=13427 RepID=A0ACB8ZQI3_CICIN|nr:hypothetical protein L2E82_44889 [Cichorium intybus]